MSDNLFIEYSTNISIKSIQPNLKIKYLEENFYAGIRNELTLIKLKKLLAFAKNIPEPALFGTYINEKHYEQTVQLMLGSNTEARKIGIFLNRLVLPLLKTKDALLEVGPANGYMTTWIGNKFKYVTAVDTNKLFIEQLNVKKRILRRTRNLSKIHGSIVNVELIPNFYDLALISHVLYYVNRVEWMQAIENCYKAVKFNGVIVIVLGGDKFGKADLIRYYGGNPIDINELIKECITKFGKENIDVFASKDVVVTKDLNAMLHIVGLFLNDANITATKKSLINYINQHCYLYDNYFEMTTQQKFILIYK